MSRERNFTRQITEAIIGFVQGKSLLQPNNFTIEGPVRNTPTEFDTFAGLFPGTLTGTEGTFAIVGSQQNQDLAALRKLSRLETPQRIKNLGIETTKELKCAAEALARMQGTPLAVIAFGRTQDKKEEVITLINLPGIDPQEIIHKMKDRARRKLTSLS